MISKTEAKRGSVTVRLPEHTERNVTIEMPESIARYLQALLYVLSGTGPARVALVNVSDALDDIGIGNSSGVHLRASDGRFYLEGNVEG